MYKVLPLHQGHTQIHNSAVKLSDYKPTLSPRYVRTQVPAKMKHQTIRIPDQARSKVMFVDIAITDFQTQTSTVDEAYLYSNDVVPIA